MCSELTIETPERHQLTSILFNPIKDGGGGGKKPPLPPHATSFFPVTSTNVGISPQNF